MTRPLHRGVAPIADEMLVRINGGRCLGTPEDVFIRSRLSGPAHHEVIGRRFGFHPRVDWVDLIAKLVIVAGAGVVVGMWLS